MGYIKVNFLVQIFVFMGILLLAKCMPQEYEQNNYLGIEPPNFFNQDPSPLRSRESLQSPAYYDFLNTLYRHDKTKADLFQGNVQAFNPVYPYQNQQRRKRAIIFRPLFVYRQQQVKRQRVKTNRI